MLCFTKFEVSLSFSHLMLPLKHHTTELQYPITILQHFKDEIILAIICFEENMNMSDDLLMN